MEKIAEYFTKKPFLRLSFEYYLTVFVNKCIFSSLHKTGPCVRRTWLESNCQFAEPESFELLPPQTNYGSVNREDDEDPVHGIYPLRPCKAYTIYVSRIIPFRVRIPTSDCVPRIVKAQLYG